MNGYYDYDILKERALKFNASQKDIDALGEWYFNYGGAFWNGEYYDVDGQHRLYPVFEEEAPDEWKIVGYEVRL